MSNGNGNAARVPGVFAVGPHFDAIKSPRMSTSDTPGVAGPVHQPTFAEMSSVQRSNAMDQMSRQVEALTQAVNALRNTVGAVGAMRVPAFGDHNLPLDEQIERLRVELGEFIEDERRAHQSICEWMDTHSAHHRANNADMETFWNRLRWILFGDAGPRVQAHVHNVKAATPKSDDAC